MNEFKILSPQSLKFNYLKIFELNDFSRISNSYIHRSISSDWYEAAKPSDIIGGILDYRLSGELNNKIRTRLISENIIDKIYK